MLWNPSGKPHATHLFNLPPSLGPCPPSRVASHVWSRLCQASATEGRPPARPNTMPRPGGMSFSLRLQTRGAMGHPPSRRPGPSAPTLPLVFPLTCQMPPKRGRLLETNSLRTSKATPHGCLEGVTNVETGPSRPSHLQGLTKDSSPPEQWNSTPSRLESPACSEEDG